MKLRIKKSMTELTVVILFLVFMSNTKAISQEYYIMVGKVYSQQKCGSASFSNALAYDVEKKIGNFNYSEVESTLKKRAARINYVSESDVYTEGARKQFACIITYDKEHAGWGCSTKQYAVGFGNSETDAEENAVLKMKNNYKRVSYFVQRRIDASMY